MNNIQITQDMIDAATEQENELLSKSPALLAAENQHLQQRVVLLRAVVNELEEKLKQYEPEAETAAGEGIQPAAND